MGRWEMVRLGDVCDILDHMRVPVTASKRKPGIYPYYGANGIQDYVSEYIFDDELVLLAEDGGNFGSKDKPISYRVSGKCWVNNHAHVLKPREMLSADYLCYSIMFYDVTSLISGTTRAKLNQAAMRKITIPLPSLEIQQQIADVLDRASALIEKCKVQIGKLDLLVKSQFVEMFGDPVMNPMGWKTKPLEEYTLFLTSGSRGWSGYFSDDGEMFLTIKNVKNCSITTENIQYVHAPDTKEAERTRVKEGDLLISITADLGRTGVVSAEIADYGAYINQHLSLVRLDRARINPNFLSHYLETAAGKKQFESKNQVGVKAGLNFNAINSLTILAPPLELQNRFIMFVEAADKSKFEMREQLAKLEMLYKSLMQKCFRGEVF